VATATSKASKTAAIIAAAKANQQKSMGVAGGDQAENASESSLGTPTGSALISEDEVRRYLSRTPMTTKELLHKFRSKTQNTMTNEQLLQSLKTILNKLNAKMIEQNGVKYLSLV